MISCGVGGGRKGNQTQLHSSQWSQQECAYLSGPGSFGEVRIFVLLAHTDDFSDISISLYPTSALPVHFDTRGADNTRIGRAAANQIEVLKSNQPSLFLPFQYTKLRPSFLESHLQPTIKLFYSNNCYQHSTYSLTYLAPVTKNPQIHHRDQPTLLATDHHPS